MIKPLTLYHNYPHKKAIILNLFLSYWSQRQICLIYLDLQNNLVKWFPISYLVWEPRNVILIQGPVLKVYLSGNILCVWTFNKKDVELKPSFANLLKCLSVFDTIFLVSRNFNSPEFSRLVKFSSWLYICLNVWIYELLHELCSCTGNTYIIGK